MMTTKILNKLIENVNNFSERFKSEMYLEYIKINMTENGSCELDIIPKEFITSNFILELIKFDINTIRYFNKCLPYNNHNRFYILLFFSNISACASF